MTVGFGHSWWGGKMGGGGGYPTLVGGPRAQGQCHSGERFPLVLSWLPRLQTAMGGDHLLQVPEGRHTENGCHLLWDPQSWAKS